jgi:type I restriction-modification system DNA methylase subunit
MANERQTDLMVAELLRNSGIEPMAEKSGIVEIDAALKTASKRGTGNLGRPEYICKSGDFILVIEDKDNQSNHIKLNDSGNIDLDTVKSVTDYAVNGAVFYAKHIVNNTAFKKVFAFGVSGDKKHHRITPYFCSVAGESGQKDIETFENFSAVNIKDYYEQAVCGIVPPENITTREILSKAKELHEYLRNYGGLKEEDKPLVVSAILLALREKENGFSLSQLTGDTVKTDGQKIYEQLKASLTRANVAPEVKKEMVLDQFKFIADRPKLNGTDKNLAKTPIKFFAEFIERNILAGVRAGGYEDYLGRFYGEFVSYTGGDGKGLGVVLTPKHITELFCELVDLKPTDRVYDPCCGTGGFLISALHKMLMQAETDEERRNIKKNHIYGTEILPNMFTIATTNMILRGDGQSNLICTDCFSKMAKDTQLKGITVGFMNPPYSQRKGRETNTAHLSEIKFVEHLLDSVLDNGRVAVIVPLSIMVGKDSEDKITKAEILKKHTLEGVISLNKQTFYPVGTVPCIALFTTGIPHEKTKKVKFINYEDDGFELKMHIGRIETERARDRKQYLLDCWRGKIQEPPSKFMIETTVEASDEWLHSFYYYNDELPTEEDFMKTIADYLTFEFNMITHGRKYLFEDDKAGE